MLSAPMFEMRAALQTASCRGAQACALLAGLLAVTPHRQEHHPKQAFCIYIPVRCYAVLGNG